MDTLTKRYLLFLVGCIGTRVFLVYLAKTISIEFLQYMGFILLVPAVGFLFLYFSGLRSTGPEVFGERIWWNDLRPIHGMLYLLFSISAIYGNKDAWIFLFIDVVFGLFSFIHHHFIRN